MRTRNFAIAVLVFVFSKAAFSQEATPIHPLSGKLMDAQSSLVSFEKLSELVRQHRFVFVGEKHDNPQHHEIESRLIKMRFDGASLKQQGKVVFEMLDESQDQAIATLKPSDSLDQMRTNLSWPAKTWDWAIYGPLFQEALRNDALSSGNIGKALVGQTYREGQKSLEGNPRFTTVPAATESIKAYLLDQIFAAHCGMQSRETLQPMLVIQLAKDASMAAAMRDTTAAMLIAGGEHVRAETGAPWHLKKAQPEADILIIQLVETKPGLSRLEDYLKSVGKADLYWFTEATPEKDYCADVKGRAAQ
jgi:uncharacterized iron-regulated protein